VINYEIALVYAGVSRDKVDECMDWAFGKGWEVMTVRGSDDVWNERHSDLFLLRGCDSVLEGIERIGKAYLKGGIG